MEEERLIRETAGAVDAPVTGAGVPVVRARGLTRHFGRSLAVAGVDFDVRPGECFGILGANGAGKTTIIRMTGCTCRTGGGELSVFGIPADPSARAIKARLGVVPQEDTLDADLDAGTNLLVYAGYFGIPKRDAAARARLWLEFFGLRERRSAKISELSTGLRRRLLIARALINEPRLLLLDEPTASLDFASRQAVWEKLAQLRGKGITLLIATHNMEEAQRLCDRVIILDKGRSIASGEPRQLLARELPPEVVEVAASSRWREAVPAGYVAFREERNGKVLLYTYDGLKVLACLKRSVLVETDVLYRASALGDLLSRLTRRGEGTGDGHER